MKIESLIIYQLSILVLFISIPLVTDVFASYIFFIADLKHKRSNINIVLKNHFKFFIRETLLFRKKATLPNFFVSIAIWFVNLYMLYVIIEPSANLTPATINNYFKNYLLVIFSLLFTLEAVTAKRLNITDQILYGINFFALSLFYFSSVEVSQLSTSFYIKIINVVLLCLGIIFYLGKTSQIQRRIATKALYLDNIFESTRITLIPLLVTYNLPFIKYTKQNFIFFIIGIFFILLFRKLTSKFTIERKFETGVNLSEKYFALIFGIAICLKVLVIKYG